jgi:osmotically-inducible protein OsmY
MNPETRNRSRRARSAFQQIGLMMAIVLVIGMAACAAHVPIVERDDQTITNDIRARFAADAQTSPLKITVVTTAGVVQLSGSVATEPERTSVERIARETPGVRTVDNDVMFGM